MSADRAQLTGLMWAPLQIAITVVAELKRCRPLAIPCAFGAGDAALGLLFASARILRLRRGISREAFERLAGSIWVLAADAAEESPKPSDK